MGDGSCFLGGASVGLELGGGQPEGTGVADGCAMSDGVRTDQKAEPFDGHTGLRDARTTRRDGVQDDGGTWIPGDLENLLRGGDCLEVVNLRPAWNDDEVGDAGGL